ncbi:MAG: 4-(cytidine 5'-diphospho)-2-C-methyl-D-erythritol kinase [Thiotrichales bacterium]|nr:4-(cytidine 5'-diphospho)-2-C-methyl-D-erythritol kinase [Thiotrichales bacterium]
MIESGVIELPAPAKLNLFLHVVGRRADGYHELQTVFQFIDLADRVRIARRNDSLLRRTTAIPGVEEAEDLTVRAAQLLRDTSEIEAGANITLEKRIPAGGGLGGGSSDAASVLVGLDRLWGLAMGTDRLAVLGARLGADVPVFVRGLASWGEGVGERLVPITLEEPWYVLVMLPCAVSTADVFQASSLTRNTPRIRMNHLLRGESGTSEGRVRIERLLLSAGNDCEPVVRQMHPEVGEALDWLSRHARARMTGTGATVFAPFESREQAAEVAEKTPAPWRGLVARGLNQSPLLDATHRAAAQ